jgi:ABC-2 type transport system permease protein
VVATLLKLRFRVLGNTLAANPWQLVGFILGGLWAVGLLIGVWIGLFAAGFAGLDVVAMVVTAGGGILVLGWALGPLFIAGVDTTLDPVKLAPFPLTTNKMMVALTAAGLTGIPGIASLAGALGIFLALWRWPIALVAALVCIPLGILTCVVVSRLITTLSSSAGGNRRTRELIGGLAFLLIMLAGPITVGIMNLLDAGVSAAGNPSDRIGGIISAASWTPIAAAWAVPATLASGDILGGVLKLLIGAATLVLLWWLWRRSLAAALVSPPRARTATVKAGKIGWFGRMPTGGTGATWARALTYWLHDPRYLRQLLVVPVFPVLMLFYSGGDVRSPMFAYSAVLVAFVLSVVSYADVSYDGTAFATVLATGVRGRQDRAGRLLAAAALGVPVTIAIAVITVGLSTEWSLLVPVLGASLGLLLTGYGVCAISSASIVQPVPAPGDSPFKRVPGASVVTALLMFVIWIGIAVLSLPSLIPAILAGVTGDAMWGFVALAAGLVLGVVFAIVGVLVGGRVFDRNAPALLAQLQSFKGA